MTKPNCRIAVIGLDHWYSALMLLPAFAQSPSIDIAGIAHDHLGRAQEVASSAGIERVGNDPFELIEDETIDAVAIFASTDRNPALCIAAADAGKHILSAKPMARTLEEASEVLAAVGAAGVHFLPAESMIRWGPADLARDRLVQGWLGDIAFAQCSISAGLPQTWPDDPTPGWFVDPQRCAGGGWIDHAIYQIDRLRWVLGTEFETISGLVANVKHRDLQVEDWGSALAVLETGVPAELRNDWFMPTTAMFQSRWELAGTGGAVRVDEVAGRAVVASAPVGGAPFDGWTDLPVPPTDLATTTAAHIADFVSGAAEPRSTVEDAWKNLAVALAFYEAASTGSTARVKEMPSQ